MDRIDLQEAARILGKSSRQVMRYVATGILRAEGGGRGVPYSFSRAEIDEMRSGLEQALRGFRRRRKWAGRIDGKTLAGIAYCHATDNNRLSIFTELWRDPPDMAWELCSHVAGWVRDSLTDEKMEAWRTARCWSRALAKVLTPLEMDYIAGMFIARRYSLGISVGEYEKTVVAVVCKEIIESLPAYYFEAQQEFKQSVEEWEAVEPFYRARGGRRLAKRFLNPDNRDDAWRMYARFQPGPHILGELNSALRHGNDDALQAFIERYPVIKDKASILFGRLRINRVSNRQARISPSGNQVCAMLGIHRQQGARIVEAIGNKIGAAGIVELFQWLRIDMAKEKFPRAWRAILKHHSTPQPQVKNEVDDLAEKDQEEDVGAFLNEQVARMDLAGKERKTVTLSVSPSESPSTSWRSSR